MVSTNCAVRRCRAGHALAGIAIATMSPAHNRHASAEACTVPVLLVYFFTARFSYASAVLWVEILSVRLSICHTRALWLIQRTYRRYLYATWKGNPSSFLPPKVGDVPFHLKWAIEVTHPLQKSRRQISTCNMSTVRASEKVQLWQIGSRTRAFQQAEDEVRTLPLSLPKGGWKSEHFFLFLNKTQLQLNEVCYKVSLTENFQQQSCSTIIPLSNGS